MSLYARRTDGKAHKYHARPCVVDNIRFASQKEAKRYGELRLLEKAGHVRALRLQPRYALCPLVLSGADVRNLNAGTPTDWRIPVAHYIADFEYEESDRGYGSIKWMLVVEDVKGMKTDIYRLKKCWFEAQYGITIREI